LENLKKIIDETLAKVNIQLDSVGAKKSSREIVKRNLDELKEQIKIELVKMIEEIEDDKAVEMAKLKDSAADTKSRLVISGIESILKDFRLMVGK
jgi:hypothetical protein